MKKQPFETISTEEAIVHMKNGGICKTQYNHEIKYLEHKDKFYIYGGITFNDRYLEPEEMNQWELHKKDTKQG